MTTEILHPDLLGPGDTVGPLKILEVLGAGGLGRVFKVESEGRVYALKMAVRPPGERLPGEEDVDGRCVREATAMLECTPHPHIPRVFQVGRWPEPESGFLSMLMEHIEGWRFHDWRYEKHPTAAQLLDVLQPIARTLVDLHKHGIHHRDLHANNIIIRRRDGRPFVLDFGSVRLPGARTLTRGMPPMDMSVLPPEALEQARTLGDDARFEGGEAADLYAFGVLLYSALTDGYPFNPELPPERLAVAIRLGVPRAPHRINPKVPLSLSAIALRLLEKRPEDRFPSAEALHQALWEASKARASREWKVSLDLPESGPAPMTEEEVVERELEEQRRRDARSRETEGEDAPPEELPAEEVFTRMSTVAVRRTKVLWTWEHVRRPALGMATACVLVAGLVALASWWSMRWTGAPLSRAEAGREVAPSAQPPEARPVTAPPGMVASTPAPPAAGAIPPEESTPVKTPAHVKSKLRSAARSAVGAALACSALTGCPSAQVRPTPAPEACPEGALETMERWDIRPGDEHLATFVPMASAHVTTVREGWASVFITGGQFKGMTGAAELSGHLIFEDRIYGRLTKARVEGRVFPVCFELSDLVQGGRGVIREPNGGSGDTAKVFSSVYVRAVRRFE